MSDNLENRIQELGLVAPRLTPDQIESAFVAEQYYVFPGTTVTVCCLTLKNGFNVIGHSAAISPENFNEEIGRCVARKNAVNEIWALEGYLLKQKLFEAHDV